MTTNVETAVPKSVLAIYAHPNDAELVCGGTLALWSRAGTKAGLVVVCAGDKGGSIGVTGSLKDNREREVEMASKQLAVEVVARLGFSDGEFDNDLKLRSQLVNLIREFEPEIVITHDPTAWVFGNVYVNHRDHRTVGSAVLDVVQSAVPNEKYFPESKAHVVEQLWLTATEDPNVAVDISTVINNKVAAMGEHHSQIGDVDQVAEVVKNRAANDGQKAKLDAAEVFRRIRLAS